MKPTLLAMLLVCAESAFAADIAGVVTSSAPKYATVVSNSDLVPNPGDKAKIYFKLPGVDAEISVATGHVYEITGPNIMVQIDRATGTVAKDQLVRITSANPKKKGELQAAAGSPSASPAGAVTGPTGQPQKDQLGRITSENPQAKSLSTPMAPSPQPVAPAVTEASPGDASRPKAGAKDVETSRPTPQSVRAPEPSPAPETARNVLTFDELQAGPLSPDAFAARGVRVVRGTGDPGVYQSERHMVLPPGRNNVLLLGGGERVTSLTITFRAPIKRFSLTRIGTAGGASVPTWRLDALDGAGKVVGSVGEAHGLPQTPQQFSVVGAGIVRVQLSTDNRFGTGSWATWSSLPVVEFEFEYGQ